MHTLHCWRTRIGIGLALSVAVSGCAPSVPAPMSAAPVTAPVTAPAAPATAQPAPVEIPHRIGGDRDPHGCIGSAGYLWCARIQRCARPWELARQRGFDADAFQAYCAEPEPGAGLDPLH